MYTFFRCQTFHSRLRARCVRIDTLPTLAPTPGHVVDSFPLSDEERPTKGETGSIQEPSTDNSSSYNKQGIDDIPNPPKPKSSRVRNLGGPSEKTKAKGSSTSKKKKPFVRPSPDDIDVTNEYMCQFFSATGMIPMKLVTVLNEDKERVFVEVPLVQPKQIKIPIPYAKDDKGLPVQGSIAEIVSFHVGVLTEDTAMSKIENFIDKYPRIWSAIIVAISCIAYVRLSQMAGARNGAQEQAAPVQSGEGAKVPSNGTEKTSTST